MDRAEFFQEARSDLTGPLDSLRVLDVTTVWSGPMTTCLLADLGAEVIRVEMPGNRAGLLPPAIPGTGLSWFHETVNRNKRSVGLDLRHRRAQEVFLRLVATADVVVENFRPGVLDGWGIGYRACRAVRQDIVFVSVTGWGQYGAHPSRRGYDPVIQAESGWMSLNGDVDGPPAKAPTFLADDLVALHGALATLAAVRHRDRTGEGQHVDVAMLDSLLYQSDGFLTLAAAGDPPARWGDQSEFVAPSNRFACADGHIFVAVPMDRQWRALAALIGRPELARSPGFATNAQRRNNREAVNALVAQWCGAHCCEEAVARLEEVGIAAGRVRTFREVADDPHVRERGMLTDVVLSNGTRAPLVGPAAKFGRTPTAVRSGAPVAGSDTEAVLAAAGCDRAELAELRGLGAIR